VAYSLFPAPMPKIPAPGQVVRWRDLRHAHALGWAHLLGPGRQSQNVVEERSCQQAVLQDGEGRLQVLVEEVMKGVLLVQAGLTSS